MQSLLLGLLAALLWGLHDFTVRRIGGIAGTAAMLVVAFGSGAVFLVPLALTGLAGLDARAVGFALLSGLSYTTACFGLYRAFAIGPVRLVAPICGAYPVLSLALAATADQPVGWLDLLGVLAVTGGIALVARGKSEAPRGSTWSAIAHATLAAVSFALTFALVQAAAAGGGAFAVALVMRLAALAAVLAWIGIARPALGPALLIWRPLVLMGALDVGALCAVTYAGGLASPEYAAVAASVFGLVTIVLAWRFLGEAMRPLQWLGAAIAFGGIASLGI